MDISSEILSKAKSWLDGNYAEETKDIIKDMMDNNHSELIDAFYKNLEFGTGGLRGIMGVGTNRINKYTIGMATQGYANYIKQQFPNQSLKVAVGYDNRNNNSLFADTVSSVFAANGFTVYLFDALRPTPELSFAVRHLNCQGGVMITASHNPKEYNGYKAYWSDGAQVTSPHDTNIIEEVNAIATIDDVRWNGGEENIIIIGEDVDNAYIDLVKKESLSPDAVKKHSDMKIVYTPIHGTGVAMMPKALKSFGFNNVILVEEQCVIDGNFPTVAHPNPEDPAAMKMAIALAEKENAEIILATDPDADRIAVGIRDNDNNIFLINGNQTCVLFTSYILRRWKECGKFSGNDYVIKTIVTTSMMKAIADSYNVECYNVLTGFKYIAEIIRENEGKKNYICGGEESFGFLIGDFVRDKDAITACSIFAEMAAWCKERGTTIYNMLMDLYIEFGLYHDGLRNVVKKGITGAAEIKQMMADYRATPPTELAGLMVTEIYDYQTLQHKNIKTGVVSDIKIEQSNVLQFVLEDGSMLSVRPSGTEPKIKYYYGVKEKLDRREDYIEVRDRAQAKINAIEKSLGL